MPFVGSDYAAPVLGRSSFGTPGLAEQQQAASRLAPGNYGALTTIAGDVALSPLDLVDTVASSIGLSERGQINNAALGALDMPGLNDFYAQNRGGIEVASGIAGTVAADLIARRLAAPASVFMQAASKLPYIRRLVTLDAEYANAMQTVRNVDSALAARGALGAEQYTGRVVVDRTMFDSASGEFLTAPAEVARNVARRTALLTGFAKGAKYGLATEGVMALGLNQNGFLYDDDAGHNLAFAALGGVLGGGAEWLHGAYQMRKFVNSEQIRRTFAESLDPDAVEEARLIWHGRQIDKNAPGPGTFLGGTISDRVTSLLVNSTLLKESPIGADTADARALLSQRESLATQHLKLAREEVQKITTRGISTNGFTRFSMDSRGFGNHLDMMMYRDPGSVYGAEMIGGIGDDMTIHSVHESHMTRLDERIKEVEDKLADPANTAIADDLTKMRQRLEFEKSLTPMAAIDGELLPVSEAQAIEGFREPDIRFVRTGDDPTSKVKDKHGLWEARTESVAHNVSLDSDLIFHLPGNKTLNNTDHFDILRLYRLAQRAIPELAKFEGPIRLPAKPSWFQLDMAEEILRQSGDRANIIFPAGMTRDSAQVESLVQKAEALKKWDSVESLKASRAEANSDTYEGQLSKLRVRYNLPRLTGYERGVLGETEHPVEQLLRGIGSYGVDEVRKMSLQDLKQATADFKRLGDIAPASAKDVDSLYGSSFKYMLDESGQPIKPLLVYKRPFEVAEWTKEYVAERIAANKLNTIARLTEDQASPMTKGISGTVIQSPDFDLAARTHELMDIQIQGGLSGSAPQTFMGSLGNATRTSEWRDRDNPIMLAATRIRETINRQARDYMRAIIEGSFGDSLSRLENPRNAASKLLLNQFHSFRSGWDLARNVEAREGGFHAFGLADTQANRDRFKQVFGREMGKGQTLIAPGGREVVLDDLGLELQTRFNGVTDALRNEKNTLLRANGRGEINRVEWFTPPPNTNGKYIGFVIGPDGKPVPGFTIVEDTQEAFTRAREALTPKINDLGMGHAFRTQDEIRDFATIWDRAQMDFIDPGTTAIQPNKRARGALTGAEVKTDAWAESLQYVRDQFLRHANDITETLFKDQINAAKARANIAADVSRNKAGFYRDQKGSNIYEMYLQNLLGSSKLNSTNSFVGRIYNSIEGSLDKFLSESTPPVSKTWIATNDWLNKRLPWSKSEQARKDFDALSSKLGLYMPFESATHMLERQGLGAAPLTVAKLTGGINKFSAAMLLRILEVGQPIMNLTGIVNAMPSVIRHIAQRDGESVADYAARVGHASNIFQLADGRQIGVLDMSKIAANSFRRAWSQASHADYDYMVRQGFLTQEVAEFQRQFGAIKSKGSWEKFFTGDPHSANKLAKKGLVGWLSILSDKSEDFSRSWGHMAGLELADVLGIETREARHAFAHDIANKMIANYSPHNRPEIFQGALGAPIGLFQSFILNYYQRLFRYAETKDYRALATQFATQAALFGVTGVPGWQQVNNFMLDRTGDNDATSGIWRKFGGPAGDLIGGGVISNLPKLFGGEAIDLYSRGDTNVRIPGLGGNSIPAWGLIQKFWEGINTGLSAFSETNPGLSSTQMAEIASNMIANRPLAGMIEQFFAGGNDTDAYGQLVTDTRTNSEMAYRLIGLRSMRQSREVQAFYANKNAQEHKAANDEVLRLATRAAIRSGNMDSLPGIFQQYLTNGGRPEFFRRWLKENYQAATDTRAQRQLEKALKDPSKMSQVLRLLDAGVSIDSDEKTPDPSTIYPSSNPESTNIDDFTNISNAQ